MLNCLNVGNNALKIYLLPLKPTEALMEVGPNVYPCTLAYIHHLQEGQQEGQWMLGKQCSGKVNLNAFLHPSLGDFSLIFSGSHAIVCKRTHKAGFGYEVDSCLPKFGLIWKAFWLSPTESKTGMGDFIKMTWPSLLCAPNH